MPEQVPFIDREHELALVDTLIREWGTLRILCINAPGGIGKTRLLQEVREQYKSSKHVRLTVQDIIDFDDHTFHVPKNVEYRIAQMLEEKTFQPYLLSSLDYHKMATAGVSFERLKQALSERERTFIECFNQTSDQKRIVLFFDTTDALKSKDFWNYFAKIGIQFKNTLIMIAGRDARNIGTSLQSDFGKEVFQIVDLSPLQEKGGREYLRQKQKLLHIELEPELVQKLLLLSGGNPILMDLTVEWRAREIPLDWLLKSELEEIRSLSKSELTLRQQEFERQLVIHIAQTRSQMDWLILLMAHVYPLDREMITVLRGISEDEAKSLFEKAKTYIFVKRLPDGRITLHDEMRRMIDDYVWSEVDPEGGRRRHDSELTAQYLESKIEATTHQIAHLEEKEKNAAEKGDAGAELDAFTERETLERKTWYLRAEYLKHTLFVDINKGVKIFCEMFDEAKKVHQFFLRDTLFIHMQNFIDRFSSEQLDEINERRIKHLLDIGEDEQAKELAATIANKPDIPPEQRVKHLRYAGNYEQATKLATEILNKPDISPELRVNMFISRANAEIRLGHVKKGISDFEKALTICETNELPVWHIRVKNGLGWAHRLTGNFERAEAYYQEARLLCLQEGGLDKKELKDDYGWIANNLAFVLSENSKTRQIAIDMARSTLEYWRSIGNDIGLGACYLVLGITYYRNALSKLSLDAFQKALNIFEPLNHHDRLAQIYSWRGALYQDMEKLDEAIRDLEESLRIGTQNIRAMTLNRLGRVYMSQEKWDVAEEYIQKSLECAQQIPDYKYWLSSVARLISIAAAKKEYQRLDEFEQMLKDCLSQIEKPEKNALGVAYLGLAKLALGQNDLNKKDIIIDFLKQGIFLVTEFGSYARTGILSRLAIVEKHFHGINPEIIRSVGQALRDYIGQKAIEEAAYSIVTPIIYKWADWEKEG